MIQFILGLMVGAFITWAFIRYVFISDLNIQVDYFRGLWIEDRNSAQEYLKKYLKLKSLLRRTYNLIDIEFTFRRHSTIWKKFKGIEIHDELKKWHNENH